LPSGPEDRFIKNQIKNEEQTNDELRINGWFCILDSDVRHSDIIKSPTYGRGRRKWNL